LRLDDRFFSEAILHLPGAQTRSLEVHAEGDVHRVRIPDLGVYGVVELREAGS
jgi:hypothetical protein